MIEIERRKQRWIDFYRLDGKKQFLLMAEYPKRVPMPPLWYENSEKRIDWALRSWENAMEDMPLVCDDCVPSLHVATGTEIFAEAMGCPVHYPRDSPPFALPCVNNSAEAAKLKTPRWEDTRLAVLFEMADKMKKQAGADAVLRMPDIQSPLDIAALVWKKISFYPAMIEEPNAIHDIVMKIKDLLTGFLDAWFARYGIAYVSHFPENYMQGGICLSEDEIGAISPSMFCEYVFPSLKELSLRYNGLSMHCCADSERQWENLKTIPGLKLINLYRPIESGKNGWKTFANTCAQYPVPCGSGEMDSWPAQYPPGAHTVLTIEATSRDEAAVMIEKMRSSFLFES
jgi:hypothetical protein